MITDNLNPVNNGKAVSLVFCAGLKRSRSPENENSAITFSSFTLDLQTFT